MKRLKIKKKWPTFIKKKPDRIKELNMVGDRGEDRQKSKYS